MGYIYLIENTIGNETRYKIGYTNNLERRKKQLETGNPGEMNIIKSFFTKWNRKLESRIHKKFLINNIKNEWFILNNNDIDSFINECIKMEDNFDLMSKENFFFKKLL